MPSKERNPILNAEDAKHFVEREQLVNQKRKKYAKQKLDQFEKVKKAKNRTP